MLITVMVDAAHVEAGLELALNMHATIGVAYTGQLADHAAKGKVSCNF